MAGGWAATRPGGSGGRGVAEGLTLALASHVNSYFLIEEQKYLPFLLLLRNTSGWKASQLALCLQSPVVAFC